MNTGKLTDEERKSLAEGIRQHYPEPPPPCAAALERLISGQPERIIKPWGWSQEVYRDELTRVVRIRIEPGGFCSWHKHERQFNSFHVLRGDLRIHYEGGSREIGDSNVAAILTVEPSTTHQFENETKETVEALEIYASADGTPPDENDIIRFSEGGINAP